MSAALAKASQLKPEIRLAQAVSQFEADLSSEQKTAFRSYRSQSLASGPAPSDVMRLTAEIDRQVSGKGGGRCFGPRFTNFFQVVQQFAALGDVVIGGSQNIIACGVWSLVRMTFLTVGNFLSYLDKLSNLFMKIGRTAPRYQNMALLYPRSKHLQSHLFEYFIVVVRLCHKLLKFTQKSKIAQITSTLSDSDIESYHLELDQWANSIKEEINLLMATKIEEEADKNSGLRTLAIQLSTSLSFQQKLATNLRVLGSCSTYDYETTWKQSRKIGNATLFHQNLQYLEWKNEADSCTLIYTGKLGSGKSVLLANIVDDLNAHVQDTDVSVAYFFCRHDILESLNARTVIGSLARQLLQTMPDLTMLAEFCNKPSTVSSPETVFEYLRRTIPPHRKVYFVLDGLDECDSSEREILVQQLQELQGIFKLLLCVSFRVEPDSPLGLNSARFAAAKIASIPDVNPDIEAFINAELEYRLDRKALIIGEPTLILEIHEALLQGSQGMFLWVALQIQSLCAMKTDQAIRDALEHLPKTLSETFSRILRKSEKSTESYRVRILQLIMVASRPLTIEELREALSVVPGDAVWDPSRLLNDVYSTLDCCGCLLAVDEEELTVRFVHHSVKQFLLEGPDLSNNGEFTIGSANRTMADIIVTYLSYGVFGTEISTMTVPQVVVGSMPSRIIRSTLESSSRTRSLALRLLESKRHADLDIGNILERARSSRKSRRVDEFRFQYYARQCWQKHILYVSWQEPRIVHLLRRLFERKVLKGEALKSMSPAYDRGILTTTLAADDWALLTWAIRIGDKGIVNALIEYSTGTGANELLILAAEEGHETVVRFLLDQEDIKADSYDIYEDTPLSYAAANGHETIVKLLINRDDVNTCSVNTFGETPMLRAALYGQEAIVRLLAERDYKVTYLKDRRGRTPLFAAAEYGREAVVKLLLGRGDVSVNPKDRRGRTPLFAAAEFGHEAVVKLLAARNDVVINTIDEHLRTPLSIAAEIGHKAVVKLLLGRGDVSVNPKDRWGRTPLSLAAKNGNEAIVKLLVECDAVEIDSQDDEGKTPLSWAREQGHEAVVRLLQQHLERSW